MTDGGYGRPHGKRVRAVGGLIARISDSKRSISDMWISLLAERPENRCGRIGVMPLPLPLLLLLLVLVLVLVLLNAG